MQGIIIATLVVGVIGLLIGIALVFAGKKFYVEVDERIPQVRECLPGNNCGACGYAGCDAVAEAIVKGEVQVNACPINSADNIEKISQVMGVEAVAAVRHVAFVKCAGDCEVTSDKCNYIGIEDCRAAALAGINPTGCEYGCTGLGSCVKACNYDAIHVVNGVAVVDRSKCVGCGMCAAACPKHLIEVIPEDAKVVVQCSNQDRGPAVKKVCTAGCLGCTACTKQCESGAIAMNGNVAQIDYEKCTACGKCAEKCPTKIIRTIG